MTADGDGDGEDGDDNTGAESCCSDDLLAAADTVDETDSSRDGDGDGSLVRL